MNRSSKLVLVFVVVLVGGATRSASASDCDLSRPEWLMCEDFEGADAGWGDWFAASPFVECKGCSDGSNDPNRITLSDASDHVYDGRFGLHMPALAGSEHQGAELIFRTCDGDARPGCSLTGYETLYLRARVRLAPDHEYVHHFLSIGGTQPDRYWEAYGNAGCRPDGTRHVGATVDFNRDRELFFYTYFPEMRCDSGGYCSGDYAQSICDGCAERGMPCAGELECCWGNVFHPDPARVLPRGEWVCLEMMMHLNSPGSNDGEMTVWLDDNLVHTVGGMRWREIGDLQLNRANLSHYIARSDADRPNAISFDDVIVSTARIGCDLSSGPEPDGGVDADIPGRPDASPDADVDEPENPEDADIPVNQDSSVPNSDADETDDSPGGTRGGCTVSTPTIPSERSFGFTELLELFIF